MLFVAAPPSTRLRELLCCFAAAAATVVLSEIARFPAARVMLSVFEIEALPVVCVSVFGAVCEIVLSSAALVTRCVCESEALAVVCMPLFGAVGGAEGRPASKWQKRPKSVRSRLQIFWCVCWGRWQMGCGGQGWFWRVACCCCQAWLEVPLEWCKCEEGLEWYVWEGSASRCGCEKRTG